MSNSKSLVPYLILPGTCKEAVEYYANAFGGSVTTMVTYEESPVPVSAEFGERVFNAEMQAGELRIKASDDLPVNDVSSGSNISLYVHFADSAERLIVFTKLSDGGKVLFPVDGSFSMVEDRFGIRWMLVVDG